MTTDEKLQLTRDRLARLFAEDRYNRRQLEHPSWSVTELARMTGTPRTTLTAWVLEAGLGRVTRRDGVTERVLTLQEIDALAREFDWI